MVGASSALGRRQAARAGLLFSRRRRRRHTTPRPARVQVRENVTVHWGVGLNKKVVARFYYPKDSADMRLMIGGWLAGAGAAAWQR